MGRNARLRKQRRLGELPRAKSDKETSLIPDYGTHLLRTQGVQPSISHHIYFERGYQFFPNYYPDRGFLEFSFATAGYLTTAVVFCDLAEARAVIEYLQGACLIEGSFVAVPDLAYTTPRTRERVVPVRFVEQDVFLSKCLA